MVGVYDYNVLLITSLNYQQRIEQVYWPRGFGVKCIDLINLSKCFLHDRGDLRSPYGDLRSPYSDFSN